jgi:hypothetical protein
MRVFSEPAICKYEEANLDSCCVIAYAPLSKSSRRITGNPEVSRNRTEMSVLPTNRTELRYNTSDEGYSSIRNLVSDKTLGTYFPAVTPLAAAERRPSFCIGIITPAGNSRGEIGASDLS